MEMNPVEFEKIAREVFAPIYPIIAEQIKQKTGITKGTCLDVGTGAGHLGIALAKSTDLNVYLFDKSQEMLKIADRNIAGYGLETKMQTLSGDVHDIPLEEQSINLVVSRGSIFFWEDRQKAFKEIYRVLAPGGFAYIGGGFGTPELKKQIAGIMEKRDSKWHEKVKKNIGDHSVIAFEATLRSAGIPAFEVNRDEAGLWIVIRREREDL